MIPVVIAPVVSRYDLLDRMIASLTPTRRLIVVDNGRTGYEVTIPNQAQMIEYVRPEIGLGYCGGINAGIWASLHERWWMWTSNDIQFGPGDLDAITQMMETAQGPRIVTTGCTWGAMNHDAFDITGFWDDENFYPIYFDDNDFSYRARLAGVDWIEYEGNIVHGDQDHKASVTIKSNEKHNEANGVTFGLNRDNYISKWGGPPDHETFTSPWNTGEPVTYIRPNPDHRATAIKAWERK